MIKRAAIKGRDGKVWSVPPPGRHHDVIRLMADNGCPTPISGVQGFLDIYGEFVGRRRAARMALNSGQVNKLRWPPNLYSEDLW
jgi:hypothetical protein